MTTENETEQDGGRHTEKNRKEDKRTQEGKEGGRVEEEIWRSFVIFCDLLSAKDLVGKVCHRG